MYYDKYDVQETYKQIEWFNRGFDNTIPDEEKMVEIFEKELIKNNSIFGKITFCGTSPVKSFCIVIIDGIKRLFDASVHDDNTRVSYSEVFLPQTKKYEEKTIDNLDKLGEITGITLLKVIIVNRIGINGKPNYGMPVELLYDEYDKVYYLVVHGSQYTQANKLIRLNINNKPLEEYGNNNNITNMLVTQSAISQESTGNFILYNNDTKITISNNFGISYMDETDDNGIFGFDFRYGTNQKYGLNANKGIGEFNKEFKKGFPIKLYQIR